MQSSAYWQSRFSALEELQHQNAKRAVQEIVPYFDRALSQVEKEIEAWYQRFADNNGVSLADARRMLTKKELAELKWDIKEYISAGVENSVDGRWMKELENASARYHISRLDALKIRTQQAAEVAFGNELDKLDTIARKSYVNGYEHTAYEIQRGYGIGWEIGTIDNRKLSSLLEKPWTADGLTFSDRIWKSKAQLVDAVSKELTHMCILGKAPDDAIRNIARRMNVSKNQAGRLVMTESAYFSSTAQKDCFNDLGVEEYQIVATLDSHTSEICQQMDLKHFPMKDFQAGVTAPPFHVWCRSTTVPYFDDFNEGSTRAARGEDGKTYQVPADMKYADWKDNFVDKTKDPADWLKKATPEQVAKAKQNMIELKSTMYPDSFTATKAEAKNTDALCEYINTKCPDADPKVVELYSKMGKLESVESNNIPFSIGHGYKSGVVKQSSYRMSGKLAEVKIEYPKLTGDNFAGQVQTSLHEQMHLMDLYCRKDVTKAGGWYSACNEDLKDVFRAISSPDDVKMSDEVKALFFDFKKEFDAIHKTLYDEYMATSSALRDQYWNAKTISAAEYKKQLKAAEKLMNEAEEYQHRNIMGGGIGSLQDIYDALSAGKMRDKGTVIYGHGSGYYYNIENRCEETLANYGALSITRPDLIELLKKDYPDLVKILDETIDGMLKKAGV